MKELYSKIYHNLQKIDFESIWHGFSPRELALYDEHKVYFFDQTQPVDNRFLGNTSILYDGKPLAIWKVTNPNLQDPILLTTKIVHEMFHSFQKEQHEERFPDDLMMLSYPDDAVIHTIRQEENKLLASIFSEGDTSKKEAILQNFIQLRKYRAEKETNIIKQEFLTETIEGMAEYAGCMALKQLSPDHYHQVIQNNINILAEPAPFFFDIRKMSYYTGSMLCLALSDTDTSFYHEIGKESLSLFELISKGDALAQAELSQKYLHAAAEMAVEMNCEEIFIADLIQEANISLLMALGEEEPEKKDEKWLLGRIRCGIRHAIEEQTQRKFEDDYLVAKVEKLEAAVRELTEDEEDESSKFSVEELAIILDMDEEEIRDVLRLTGDDK